MSEAQCYTQTSKSHLTSVTYLSGILQKKHTYELLPQCYPQSLDFPLLIKSFH